MQRNNRTSLIIAAVAAVTIVAICAISAVYVFAVIPQGVISKGNSLEAQLSSNYSDGANYLSGCINKTNLAANVAIANTAALDKIIANAVNGQVAGRQVNLSTDSGQQFLLTTLHQAYPDVSGLNKTFQEVLIIAGGCQSDFQNKQSNILDGVRTFNNWRTGSWTVRTFGGDQFPNNNLYIAIPGVPSVHGMQALIKMEEPIVNSVASGAYKSGTYNPTNPFPTTPSPSPTG